MFKAKPSIAQIARFLMVAAIVLIACFQIYWLKKLYVDEAASFKKTTDVVFRETMYKVQAQRLKRDSFFYKYIPEQNSFMGDVAELVTAKIPQISISTNSSGLQNEMSITSVTDSINDSIEQSIDENTEMPTAIVIKRKKDSVHHKNETTTNINITQLIQEGINIGLHEAGKHLSKTKIEFHNPPPPDAPMLGKLPPMPKHLKARDVLVKSRVLNDTIAIEQIDSAYKKALSNAGITALFHITKDSLFKPDSIAGTNFNTSKVPVGF